MTLQRALETVKRLREEAALGPWEMRDGEGEGVWSLGFRRLNRGAYGRDADLRLAAAAPDLAASVVEMASGLRAYHAIFDAWEGRESIRLNEEALRQWKSIADAALASFVARFGAEQ